MSERTLILDTLPCGASSLATKQYYAVKCDNTMSLIVAVAAKNMLGILQDKPAVGEAGTVAVFGVTKAAISASQTVTKGTTLFEVDTGGTLKVLASGTAVARARESITSVAAVKVIEVEILKSNADTV